MADMLGISWLTFSPTKTNSGTLSILKIILFLLQSTCALQADNQFIPSIASNSISPSLIKSIDVSISPIITSLFTYLVLVIIFTPMGVDTTNWNPRGSDVWFNLYAKVLDMNEWVAPGSNNVREICPDMEIIPFTTAFEAIASRWVNTNALPWAHGYCTDDWVAARRGALLGCLKLLTGPLGGFILIADLSLSLLGPWLPCFVGQFFFKCPIPPQL